MNMGQIEKRLQVLEDIEAIKRLKAMYCHYCDAQYDPEGISSLFTEDGVWDGGDLWGRYEGREAIRNYFAGTSKQVPFAVHTVMTPLIEVEGERATGAWYLFMSATMSKGNQAVWGFERYDDEYVKVNGEWKMKRLKLTTYYWTPYELGWVKQRIFK
jgi:hypothetical protein